MHRSRLYLRPRLQDHRSRRRCGVLEPRARPPLAARIRRRSIVSPLDSDPSEPILFVQKVVHESRIHLDIETDDLEAEARRLEALGARRIAHVKRWIVMEAPTGQRFCILNPQRGPLAGNKNANVWP